MGIPFSGRKRAEVPVVTVSPGEFGVTQEELNAANTDKDSEWLLKQGGVNGLAAHLHSDPFNGLNSHAESAKSIEGRQFVFGANKFKDIPPKNFFVLWFNNFKDPIIILLVAAALISTILGVAVPEERKNNAWTEGVAIWVAVGVVTFVAALNDWKKDRQFQELNKQNDIIDVKAIRDGKEQLICSTDIVVGDVLVLDTGDKVVADGVYIHGHDLIIDESSLTGESDPIKKSAQEPWCRSGTKVTEGSGRVLVVAVGPFSEWGKTLAMVVRESPDTPLQEKLADLAKLIGKIGVSFAVICFVALMIRWCIEEGGFPISEFAHGPLEFFMFSVTIVVVAVPEGLPLAVTISLGYSMKKMMKDNNFVRVLAACETMGGATAICSDKTGTLTENRMTVVEGWFSGTKYTDVQAAAVIPESVKEHIVLNASVNSKAFLTLNEVTGSVDFGGNRTECALLVMLKEWGFDYKEVRDQKEEVLIKVYGFSSERKMASVLLNTGENKFRLYNKGAAEIVLSKATRYSNAQGQVVALDDAVRTELAAEITAMASTGLRTLGLAYREISGKAGDAAFDTPPEEDLTLTCVVGIKDPVRKEVPEAVLTCQQAGINVRMVTGDNIHTAQHIARECGILTEGGLALEGPNFRHMPEEEILALLPQLQVLARSSPQDKYTLVNLLKRKGEVVAVTGDGTNDAPALKEADVGLAMGIAGTEVAKEAADIVILDDNFRSIVASVLWGRNTFNSIRKFLQFQLTVNFVALVVAFVSAVTSGETPLNILQLLWVNLIMDSMGALALATELPSISLLDDKPHGRTERLISKKMMLHIFTQGLYQMFWVFLIFYGAPKVLNGYELPSACTYYSNWVNNGANSTGVNLCCNPGVNCLQSQGGIYLEGETPICEWTSDGNCKIHEPEADNICGSDGGKCQRYEQLNDWYHSAEDAYEEGKEDQQQKTNSIVFNVFIFCQIFNMFNARKINNELNIFEGIMQSYLFWAITVVMVACQIAIMEGIPGVFKVDRQEWDQWLFAVAVGLGSLPVAFITKLLARAISPYIPSFRFPSFRKKKDVELVVSSRRTERQDSKGSQISVVASANGVDEAMDAELMKDGLDADGRPTLVKNNSKRWTEPGSSYRRSSSFGGTGSKRWELPKSGSKRWDEENMGSRRWEVAADVVDGPSEGEEAVDEAPASGKLPWKVL